MKNFYLTTTLPYVNASPHIGFALEIIRADILARYHRLKGDEVFFNFGVDEHGRKIYEKALEAGMDPQAYCDEYATKFNKLKDVLNVSYDTFIRTTDSHHVMAATEFWRRSYGAGDIYKKRYQTKYCVGCELEKQDSDLIRGKCPEHPNRELELIDEENYFFRFSKYAPRLLELYENNPELIAPDWRQKEIRLFVERGLQDFSISRLKSKMPWGVPVPEDDEHVIYVWFDALVNYISVIGWPDDMERFNKWWPVVQVCGKDNLRQQGAMWQAMLMSAGLPPSKKIYVNGFIISAGQKMSKSIGNVIDPLVIVSEYGTDALRFFLAKEVTPFEDSDVTSERIKESYNAHLANGLGNLASRILTLSEKHLDKCPDIPESSDMQELFDYLENYEIKKATDYIWGRIESLDRYIQETEPFKIVKVDAEKGKEIIKKLVLELYTIARMLNPIMPATNIKLKELIKANEKPDQPLFLRK